MHCMVLFIYFVLAFNKITIRVNPKSQLSLAIKLPILNFMCKSINKIKKIINPKIQRKKPIIKK